MEGASLGGKWGSLGYRRAASGSRSSGRLAMDVRMRITTVTDSPMSGPQFGGRNSVELIQPIIFVFTGTSSA